MSEEILKALTQLFAIITKQDGGVTENERAFVIRFFQQQLSLSAVDEYTRLYDSYAEYQAVEEVEAPALVLADGSLAPEERKPRKLTSVRDSVRTLGICRKINKTLTQKQKVIAVVRLLELVNADRNFTPQRMQIIHTAAEVFNIPPEEYQLLEALVRASNSTELDNPHLLVVDDYPASANVHSHHLRSAGLPGEVLFAKVASVEMYFAHFLGQGELQLNGVPFGAGQIVLFPPGSILKTPKGEPIYYSDVVNQYLTTGAYQDLSFNAEGIEFRFPNGAIGLRDVHLSEGPGRLIAIMGASGAGKTTLLNVLAGLETPSAGRLLINGIDLHREKEKVQGMIGYVAQDDLLIEELTVYQNLYYNAQLCFRDLSPEALDARVLQTLRNLGLVHIKDLTVGNPLNKKISGGQRKRLNIALELIREPNVLFVDEPTSGLSSRDSENVIDLLKELTLKGKLIFVVIHQPSSDIYKMFDKIFIMDTGGYPAFYGHPVEAVTYFKRATNQVDSDSGQCGTCGNVNPEQIFNTIEAQVVDEYGEFTGERKITPPQWYQLFQQRISLEKRPDLPPTPHVLRIPSRWRQYVVFTTRDLLSKISNQQYLAINLLEAPLLALLLAFVIRYRNASDGGAYLYRYNENIPPFILIMVIIALFMGLTVSAEEIIRDRKIQKRETFLRLSRHSYLFSKITILFLLSAVQTLTLVWVGHALLGVRDMTMDYWLVLFSVSCFANMLGLNVSATFNSAVTIYVLIPLLLIPQLILSGAIFQFDKLNEAVGGRSKVPLVADLMVSRWGFEALTVRQFTHNRYQRLIGAVEHEESVSNFQQVYFLPELIGRVQALSPNPEAKGLAVVARSLRHPALDRFFADYDFAQLTPDRFDAAVAKSLLETLHAAKDYHTQRFNRANELKDAQLSTYAQQPGRWTLNELKDRYFNETLNELVRNVNVKEKLVEQDGQLRQKLDPIYQNPVPDHLLSYQTHFYAPQKPWLGRLFDTFWFNLAVIWLMTLVLYATLYHEAFRWVLAQGGRLGAGVGGILAQYAPKGASATRRLSHTWVAFFKKLKKTQGAGDVAKQP